ncbi:MAG: UDP-N-acetylglucosamine 2-epimerase (non-hydrolyzing) [Actinomycetota bacterium]|nr:UDP-N-acetylglucosamine 2-epimerase (non-hydrolyzing) [Actinomycetota bacterium]
MKLLSVVGNRPQFIKSAPLSVALREADIDEVVVHTGQHYDPELSRVFFEELGLDEPAYKLDLRTADPKTMRPRIVEALETEKPDWVLVYGDTNSTLAGAQAAVDLDVRVAHVEAGLRSGDLSMPEERARIAVDRIAGLLFCPDERSRDTLVAESVEGEIEVVGDVMGDAAIRFGPIARERSDALQRFGVEPGSYVLATIHREANIQPERLGRILNGLGRSEASVLLPAHPRTRATIARHGLDVPTRVRIVEPLGYLDLAALVSQARAIATDSGGLQKEAYWYGVPCVTTRPSTEWVDTVELGANELVDDDPQSIADALARARMPEYRPQLYGDGHASERIAAALHAASRSPS